MPVVVDTSVAIKWVVTEQYTGNAQALLSYHQRRNDPVYVPSLFLYEAANVLHSFVRDGILSINECTQAIRDVTRLVMPLTPDTRMIIRAVMIAHMLGTKETYDGHFLALAERTHSTFWTADARFARAVQTRVADLATDVRLIASYPVPVKPDTDPPDRT